MSTQLYSERTRKQYHKDVRRQVEDVLQQAGDEGEQTAVQSKRGSSTAQDQHCENKRERRDESVNGYSEAFYMKLSTQASRTYPEPKGSRRTRRPGTG